LLGDGLGCLAAVQARSDLGTRRVRMNKGHGRKCDTLPFLLFTK
jgi:hypothetical protein